MVSPTRMALARCGARLLLSPDRPVFVVPAEGGIRVDLVTGVQTCALVVAVGLTVTASVLVVVVLRLPSASFSVAETVSVKSLSLVGVMVRLDRVQDRKSVV